MWGHVSLREAPVAPLFPEKIIFSYCSILGSYESVIVRIGSEQ